MAADPSREARLDLRLPRNLKELIEDAAAIKGQSVRDFAITMLAECSRAVLKQSGLNARARYDSKALMALLDATKSKPNRALTTAAIRYKKRFTRTKARE